MPFFEGELIANTSLVCIKTPHKRSRLLNKEQLLAFVNCCHSIRHLKFHQNLFINSFSFKMPISSPNSAVKIRLPRPLLPSLLRRNSPWILHRNLLPNLSIHPFSRLRCTQTLSSATAQNCSVAMDLEKYARELEVAVKAVHMASLLCRRVQDSLIFKSNVHVQSKDDDSPVTVADWSVQATVSWVLSEAFGSENVSIVAEEDVETLSRSDSVGLLDAVAKTVNESLDEAPSFGIRPPAAPLNTSEVLEAISRCNSTGGPTGRFWVLDPVDGTLGFVRGDQYAIALALIEDGEPVLGVLGCPNYPMKKEWLSYQNGYQRIVSKLTTASSASWDRGCVIYAKKGSGGGAWMQPLLLEKEKKFVWPNSARQIKVSTIDNPALATFCEPVEKANSSHSFTAGLAHSVGLRNEPLRVYSMVKYAAIARGHAEIFMKFARAGYKEKIWDHAAGVVIIQEAGGVVTDAGGHPLCFSRGMYLEGLDRGIIASSGATLHEKIIRAVDASWNSSSL